MLASFSNHTFCEELKLSNSRRLYALMTGILGLIVLAVGCSSNAEGQSDGRRKPNGGQWAKQGLGNWGAEEVVPVDVARPFRANLESYVFGNANIEALREVEIMARVNGQLEKLPVEEGDLVRQGKTLQAVRPVSARQPRLHPQGHALRGEPELLRQLARGRRRAKVVDPEVKRGSRTGDRAPRGSPPGLQGHDRPADRQHRVAPLSRLREEPLDARHRHHAHRSAKQ